ncbi:MAG: hypothetical protein WC872_04485 [Candidatus Absconditabacterales bacterium]|jgi:hypothetical protein
MKNLFLIIVIGLFCFTNISAQSNEYKVKKIDNKIVLVPMPKTEELGDLKVSEELLRKYGEAKILKAWQNGNLEFNEKTSLTYNFYGTKSKKNTTKTFLQRNGNEIVEITEAQIKGEWDTEYETFFCWVFMGIAGLIFYFKWNKAAVVIASVDIASDVIAGVGVSWLVIIGIVTGRWMPLIISILIMFFSILCGYIYAIIKKKKKKE